MDIDTIIAERFAHRLAAHVADQHDLWAGPAIPYGIGITSWADTYRP